MEATRLPDGRAKLLVSETELSRLPGLVGEAREWLGWSRKGEFPGRIGLTYEEVASLGGELVILRNELLGVPPLVSRHTGEVWSPTEIREAGTAWDSLPKIESHKPSDDRFVLVLARGELSILADCVDVVLQETAYINPEGRDSELHSRMGMRVKEIEVLRDELRRLDRQTRDPHPP